MAGWADRTATAASRAALSPARLSLVGIKT
jgi:hypothetical protein